MSRTTAATITSLCDHAQHITELCHCDSPHIQSLLAQFRAACLREIADNDDYNRGNTRQTNTRNYNSSNATATKKPYNNSYNNKSYNKSTGGKAKQEEEYDDDEEEEEYPKVKPNDPRYRTVPCKYFSQGSCRRGDACTFSHDEKAKKADEEAH